MTNRVVSAMFASLLLHSCATVQVDNYSEFVAAFGPNHQKVPMSSGNYQVIVRAQGESIPRLSTSERPGGIRGGPQPEFSARTGESIVTYCDFI